MPGEGKPEITEHRLRDSRLTVQHKPAGGVLRKYGNRTRRNGVRPDGMSGRMGRHPSGTRSVPAGILPVRSIGFPRISGP
jgi:hypothetical protein